MGRDLQCPQCHPCCGLDTARRPRAHLSLSILEGAIPSGYVCVNSDFVNKQVQVPAPGMPLKSLASVILKFQGHFVLSLRRKERVTKIQSQQLL